MKRLKTIFGVILLTSFIMTSCGPSACECLDNHNQGILKSRISVTIKCNEKFGKDIPNSYRGTNMYQEEMIKILNEKCNK